MSIAPRDMSELTSEEWSAREDVLHRFEQAWRRGLRPVLEEFLPREDRQRQVVLLEMVHTDLEYRLKDDEQARVEDYLDRFPELKSDPKAERELVVAELNLRLRRDPGLAFSEFLDRFPGFRSEMITKFRLSSRADRALPAEWTARAPQKVGKYEVLGIAGRGAFGVVYRARDSELDRTVALKVLRTGHLASPEAMDRLLREARSAGRLSHPNIVPVHDAGRDGDTCFLVCEFVAGTTLADRLVCGPIETRAAATLVSQVADALHHAHTQGVIHRDVKPSNILLDQDGTPRLVDFGLALRNGGENTLTQAGEVLGTPAYMPPEQARGEAHQVDGRGDLYSLGVVLYEMLTGELPFRGSREMVLKQVLQDEPPPPRRLNNLIPREVETICLKCLQKEPARRYTSADALAEDLRRYLRSEPILARPISRLERLLKWSRRNRWLAAFLAALIAGVMVSTWQAVRARSAEQAARSSAVNARQSESEARATLEFFRDKVLAAARPKDEEGGLGIDATIRDAIDAAEPEIARQFVDQPLVEASIRSAVGSSYAFLGASNLAITQHARALELRRQYLGPDHEYTLSSMSHLAIAYESAGQLPECIPLFQQALNRALNNLGPGDPDTLSCMNNLGNAYRAVGRLEEALPLLEQTRRLRDTRLGPGHRETIISMNNLAIAYRAAGRFEDALPLYEKVTSWSNSQLGPAHPESLTFANNLANAYLDSGRNDDAVSLFEETLKQQKSTIGVDHPDTLRSANNLARAYRAAGRLNDGLSLLRQTLERQRVSLRPGHPDTLTSMNNLGMMSLDAGRVDEACDLLKETLTWRKAKLGVDHPDTLRSMNNLARSFLATQPALAEPLLRECLATVIKKMPDDWCGFETRSLLGACLLSLRKFADAEPLLLQGYEGMKAREAKIPASARRRLKEAGDRIIQLYDVWGKNDKKDAWFKLQEASSKAARPRP